MNDSSLSSAKPTPYQRGLTALLNGLSFWRLPLSQTAYAVWAFALTLLCASEYFASLRWQLFMAEARAGVAPNPDTWSAPLDDVFIHFDFARSIARGYPFEWSEGNGYSSGGTSLLYPFVLAIGYRLGYQELALMHWAGIVACISVWGCLLWGRSLVRGLPEWCAWLLPPALLSVGALNWSLFSGMEVAFFLCIWAGCVVLWQHLLDRPSYESALKFGLANAALVACRPESAVLVAALSLLACGRLLQRWGLRQAFFSLWLCGLPGALVVLAHTLANHWFTGEASAAGALVKLELNHPFMSSEQKWEAWIFHLKYQALRVTDYHFADVKLPVLGAELGTGWLVWLLAIAPLFFRATRRSCLLLWACMLSWVVVVAANGQVRWQNERYTMPAAAWLLLSAALGAGCLLSACVQALSSLRGPKPKFHWRHAAWAAAGLATLLSLATFYVNQKTPYRGQLWFFGRASRNIYEQHVAAASKIKDLRVQRVLVGDAGAIPYISDVPALDIIGLGGYHDFPFARATRMGVAAGIELIQRLPADDRPDLMAIYPNWWGELPTWFGHTVAEFPVRGNVICGGPSKVLYAPDWTALDNSRAPFMLAPDLQVRSELDVADLTSEEAQAFKLHAAPGYVAMKLLPHPRFEQQDAWDAGRVLPQGSSLTFNLSELQAGQPLQLLLRVAPPTAVELEVQVGDHSQLLSLAPADGWQEPHISFPPAASSTLGVTLRITRGELMLYHAWGVQAR